MNGPVAAGDTIRPVTISQCVARHARVCSRTIAGKRSKCRHCGGSMVQRVGWWSVQEWTAANDYTAETALSLHRSQAVADRRAAGSHVVRFVDWAAA